ncbi:MAG: hypothetical protein ACLPXB_18720 [Thiobacillaceae bacterium]
MEIGPKIERMIQTGASRNELIRIMKDAGITERTAHRVLAQVQQHQNPRTDLVKVLKWRGRDPQDALMALKQNIVKQAKSGVSRTKLMQLLCDAGLTERTARRFLEPYYQHPDPLVRLNKDLERHIKRAKGEGMKARADALWPHVLKRLKAGEPIQVVQDYVVAQLGQYGVTPANVAGLIHPLLELAGRVP